MNNKEATISKSLILKHFSFLENKGFVAKVEEGDSKLFLESFNFTYTSQIRKREITISFTKSKIDEEIRYTFSVSVVRIPYNDPYEDFFPSLQGEISIYQ